MPYLGFAVLIGIGDIRAKVYDMSCLWAMEMLCRIDFGCRKMVVYKWVDIQPPSRYILGLMLGQTSLIEVPENWDQNERL